MVILLTIIHNIIVIHQVVFITGADSFNKYGVSYLPVHVSSLNCIGNETSIWECQYSSEGTCNTYNDVTVSCQEGWVYNSFC